MTAAGWPTGAICPKCGGEGQIVGTLTVRGLSGNRMSLPGDWLDCDQCDGKGYLEGVSTANHPHRQASA